MADDAFTEFAREQLSVIGPVTAKRMFGGVGFYCDGVMFALIAYETLYLKADAQTIPAFEAEGLSPFTYEGKGKPIRMSYWQVPERALDDPDEMREWATAGLAAARRAKSSKPPSKKSTKSRAS